MKNAFRFTMLFLTGSLALLQSCGGNNPTQPNNTPTPTAPTATPTLTSPTVTGTPTGTPYSGELITVAGNGTTIYTLATEPALNEGIQNPLGVVVDASGNLYITDPYQSRILKVDTTGILNVFAGGGSSLGDGGPATQARLNSPNGIGMDSTGNLYIADTYNNRVRKVNTSGIITTVAGNGATTFSGDGGPATLAGLHSPFGVFVDTVGDLFIADTGNERIREVNTGGTINTVAGDGTTSYGGDGMPATQDGIYSPSGVVADSSGNFYFTDAGNNAVRKVNAAMTITTYAGNGTGTYGGDSGAATLASVYNPFGLAMDTSGDLYIGDQSNNRIRKVDTGGTITTVAGGGPGVVYGGNNEPATLVVLHSPSGVALDSAGNLYIADNGNNRVCKVFH